jgi:hypothetical protein
MHLIACMCGCLVRVGGVVVPRPEVVVLPGAGRAGPGAVVATLRDAATGAEDEHAARATPATPTASTILIAR